MVARCTAVVCCTSNCVSGFTLHINAMCSFMEQTVTENRNMNTRVDALTLRFETFIKRSEGGGAGKKRDRGKT